MTIGLRLLASLIDHPQGLDQYVKLRMDAGLFQGEAEAELFDAVQAHVLGYGKLPSRQTLKENGFVLLPGKQPEPPQFYFDKCRERFVFLRLRDTLKSVEGDLNDDKPTVALSRMVDTMSLCQLYLQRDRLVDAAQEMVDVVPAAYNAKLKAVMTGTDYGLLMGWPTFDKMTSGLQPGDLISLVGRPGAGKTYLMLHAANTAWMNKRPPLLISMEMSPLEMMMRAAAMLTRTPVKKMKDAQLSTTQLLNLKDNLTLVREAGVPYWIVDGALTATVDDVILLARQLRPGAIFIDGAYLLRASSSRMPRWERLTENAERIKSDIAQALAVPTVISYQFNRQAKKSAKAGGVGLEDIAYTDAIGQLSSVVLGLLQPEEDTQDALSREVEILKGRNGEAGRFKVRWNFDKGPGFMDFSELVPDGNIEFD